VTGPLPRDARVYVAGHRGLVGSAVLRHLQAQGFTNLITRTRAELDLRDPHAVDAFFAAERPEYVSSPPPRSAASSPTPPTPPTSSTRTS
jgi:GDP-L-fucose synthase